MEASSTELLEAAWGLKNLSWRALGGLQSRLGGSWRALGASWAVLEASWEVLGRHWKRIRGVLEAPRVVLEPSWDLWKPCWSHLEANKLPKLSPKRVPIRAPEATRAENDETLIFNDSTKDFNDMSGLRAPFLCNNWVQNGFRIASSTLKASESLLTGILDAVIALSEPS